MKTLEEINGLIEEKKKEINKFNETVREEGKKLNTDIVKLTGQKELLSEDVKN